MRLYLAATVQCLSIGPRRTVHRQPVLRGAQNSAAGTARPAPSRRLLMLTTIYKIETELQQLAGCRLRLPTFDLREITCMEFPGPISTTAIATRHRPNRKQAGA